MSVEWTRIMTLEAKRTYCCDLCPGVIMIGELFRRGIVMEKVDLGEISAHTDSIASTMFETGHAYRRDCHLFNFCAKCVDEHGKRVDGKPLELIA